MRARRRYWLAGGLALGLAAALAACSPAAPASGGRAAPADGTASSVAPTSGGAGAAVPAGRAAAPTSTAPATTAAAPAPLTVQAATISSTSDAGLYLGIEKGYFAEQGIQVELERIASLAEMIPLLSTGKLDVGGGAVNAGLFNAWNTGIRVVADKGSTSAASPYLAIVLRKELLEGRPAPTGAEVRGLRFGISSRGTSEVHLAAAVGQLGLSVDDVDAQIISLGDTVVALANGSLDGGVLIEPFRTTAITQGHSAVWKDSEQILPNDQTGVLVYSPGLAQRAEVGERFMAGYLQGVRRYNDAFFKQDAAVREDVIGVLMQYTGQRDRGLYDRIIPGGLNPDGKVNAERLRHYSDYFISRGYQQQAPNWDALVDPRFANAAVAKLGGPYR